VAKPYLAFMAEVGLLLVRVHLLEGFVGLELII
jgi:hypothetical protein